MLKTIPLEQGKQSSGAESYFHSFMKDCLKELKNKGETIVFNQDHIDYIKSIYQNIIVSKTKDDFFKIMIDN